MKNNAKLKTLIVNPLKDEVEWAQYLINSWNEGQALKDTAGGTIDFNKNIKPNKVPRVEVKFREYMNTEAYSVYKEFEANANKQVMVCIVSDGYSYPAHLLAPEKQTITIKVSKDYDAIVSHENITVGCQTITFETLNKLVEAVKTLNPER